MQALRETFNVELPLATAWARLRLPTDAEAPSRCRIPGFPSVDGRGGCAAAVLDSEPQRRLSAVKEDAPCAGSRIEIEVAPANAAGWPTRVTVSQSELPAAMAAMPAAVAAHWRMIVADFRLYLEREVIAPPTKWGPDFGALLEETPLGLVLADVQEGGLAWRCGMLAGDLLLTLNGARVRLLEELWAVLAVSGTGKAMAATWARGGEVRTGMASP